MMSVMVDYYSRLAKNIPASNKIAKTVARIFLEHWVVSFCIPSKPLTYNSHQFVSIFILIVCSVVGLKNNTAIEYHPQTSVPA